MFLCVLCGKKVLRSKNFMAVTVVIPTPLRQFAGGKAEIEVEAQTVGEALGKLTTEYADLKKHLYNDGGNLRNFVNIYVGDEDIRGFGRT